MMLVFQRAKTKSSIKKLILTDGDQARGHRFHKKQICGKIPPVSVRNDIVKSFGITP